MSEIGKEMEDEVVVDHWSHHHPLTLVQTSKRHICYGCGRVCSSGEHVYGCSKKCKYTKFLHEECAEMATKIRHPMHPQHILIQEYYSSNASKCAICDLHILGSIGYKCTSSGCEFEIDMICAQDRGVMDADDDAVIISHPSHPQHTLVRVSRMPCSLRCDACGTSRRGVFYACYVCRYWIHCRCAILPDTIQNMLPMSSALASTLSISGLQTRFHVDPPRPPSSFCNLDIG
ncbi:hypothetical protein C2S52_023554 [Perilla frutescens var. hirtella]|nr:hypothetical protein C2S52_023554 [Perilla frutescens var. hirtella]